MSTPISAVFKPVIGPETRLSELTIKGIILGILLAIILGAANAYLGLFAGMTISATIPAAVISMAVLSLFRRSNILENNIVMTTASAGEALAAGVIFTIPALILMDFNGWKTGFNVFLHLDQWIQITIVAGLGGVIGVLFTIPIRRALIINHPLQFPEGIATAEVLKSGRGNASTAIQDSASSKVEPKEKPTARSKGDGNMIHLVIAGLIGAVTKIFESGVHLWSDTMEAARFFQVKETILKKTVEIKQSLINVGSVGYVGTMVSPALLAVGYIVGLNIAILVFLGGFLSFFIGVPILGFFEIPIQSIFQFEHKDWMHSALSSLKEIPNGFIGWFPGSISEIGVVPLLNEPLDEKAVVYEIWAKKIKYIGVGAMIIGGVWTLIKLAKPITSGIQSGINAYRKDKNSEIAIPRTEKDIPMKWVLVLLVGSIAPLFVIYQVIVMNMAISIVMAVLMLITGFLFSCVAAYMAGLVGSSNNPVSGVTIATILLSSLLLFWLMHLLNPSGGTGVAGIDLRSGAAAAIMIGAVVCCAASIGGDNLQDLKTGYLVGATPWKQQVALMIGCVTSAVVMGPVLTLLHHSKGIGSESLPAPQANLMDKIANGVFQQNLEWSMIIIGVIVGILVIALDIFLERRKSSFRTPVLAIAVGMYLPFKLTIPILFGGILASLIKHFRRKRMDKSLTEEENAIATNRSEKVGILYAAGLITGEALVGILLAIPIFLGDQVFHLSEPVLPLLSEPPFGWDGIPGLVVLAVIFWLIYRMTTRTFLKK